MAAVSAGGILAPVSEAAGESRSKADIETATRLQVFLDRAEFAPGKIDGRYGEFTVKALTLYRQAHGGATEPTAAPPAKSEPKKDSKKEVAVPDTTGLDLASIEPVFVPYTVTEADLKNVGEVPSSVPEQAKKKSLPYKVPRRPSLRIPH